MFRVQHLSTSSSAAWQCDCNQDCWHTGLSRLNALNVNLNRPSGRYGFYASLFGSDPRWLKGDKGNKLLRNGRAMFKDEVERVLLKKMRFS